MYRASVVMFDSDRCNIESVILSDSDYSGPHNILFWLLQFYSLIVFLYVILIVLMPDSVFCNELFWLC